MFAPPTSSVDDWLTFMYNRGIERAVCLLDDQHLDTYDHLLETYRSAFGQSNVCHAPVPDFSMVGSEQFYETIVPFLEASVRDHSPTVVHCSAGLGRTGHVLALWIATSASIDIVEAIRAVQKMGRRPLEAATVDELRACLNS